MDAEGKTEHPIATGQLIAAVQRDGARWTLTLRGDVSTEQREELGEAVRAALDGGATEIVLDLAAVPFVASAGLGALVSATTTTRKHGASLAIVNPRPAIVNLLRLTRLDTMLTLA